MNITSLIYKSVVGALLLAGQVFLTPAQAQTVPMDGLFDRLQTVAPEDAPALVEKIVLEWSKSGSPAMDYLLRRGKAALAEDDLKQAVDHFTALTDHAPEFAEGWHALAVAYFGQDRFGPALYAIERTLALEPRHFPAMEGLMVLLEDAGQSAQALKVAEMIEAIHPHHPDLSSFKQRLLDKTKGRDL